MRSDARLVSPGVRCGSLMPDVPVVPGVVCCPGVVPGVAVPVCCAPAFAANPSAAAMQNAIAVRVMNFASSFNACRSIVSRVRSRAA